MRQGLRSSQEKHRNLKRQVKTTGNGIEMSPYVDIKQKFELKYKDLESQGG